jgi:hypothetical protein
MGRMSAANQHEIVMLYDANEQIENEIFYSDFEQWVSGECKHAAYAASQIRAAYCLIGNGLRLRSVVFFVFKVNEEGKISSDFNLPLQYMALHAGVACDLGQGVIRKASRAQCPVPWHAINTWEPAKGNGVETVQKRIFRNKLKLKPVVCREEDDIFARMDVEESLPELISESLMGEPQGNLKPISNKSAAAYSGSDVAAHNAKLRAIFGDAGKLTLQDLIRMHAEQLDLAQGQYRQDLEKQQSHYLDQVRAARDEIHELKVALRQEQSRNRRLQQMLRGDI